MVGPVMRMSRSAVTTAASSRVIARSVSMTLELPPYGSPDKGWPGDVADQTLVFIRRRASIFFDHGQLLFVCFMLILVVVVRVNVWRALARDQEAGFGGALAACGVDGGRKGRLGGRVAADSGTAGVAVLLVLDVAALAGVRRGSRRLVRTMVIRSRISPVHGMQIGVDGQSSGRRCLIVAGAGGRRIGRKGNKGSACGTVARGTIRRRSFRDHCVRRPWSDGKRPGGRIMEGCADEGSAHGAVRGRSCGDHRVRSPWRRRIVLTCERRGGCRRLGIRSVHVRSSAFAVRWRSRGDRRTPRHRRRSVVQARKRAQGARAGASQGTDLALRTARVERRPLRHRRDEERRLPPRAIGMMFLRAGRVQPAEMAMLIRRRVKTARATRGRRASPRATRRRDAAQRAARDAVRRGGPGDAAVELQVRRVDVDGVEGRAADAADHRALLDGGFLSAPHRREGRGGTADDSQATVSAGVVIWERSHRTDDVDVLKRSRGRGRSLGVEAASVLRLTLPLRDIVVVERGVAERIASLRTVLHGCRDLQGAVAVEAGLVNGRQR
mmetsp:Transcript_34878/g.74378  ORF Transcript_34878/g.74378 Transcript_34878/m.74378 type:complete len:554 (+) Transcript_34878:2280-3941(+)